MKRKSIAGIVGVTCAASVVSVVGFSNGSHHAPLQNHHSVTSSTPHPSRPVWVPKNEPNEDRDVTAFRVVQRPGVNGPDMYATCTIKNHTSEVSNYVIKADVVSVAGTYDTKSVEMMVRNVPPGKTVPCDAQWLGGNYNLADWKVVPTKIDRFSVKDESNLPDEQGALTSIALKQKVVNGQRGMYLVYAVTNTAYTKSSYMVKFNITNVDSKVVYRSSFETKGLESGQIEAGSVRLPDKLVRNGLQANALDVDRTLYVQRVSGKTVTSQDMRIWAEKFKNNPAVMQEERDTASTDVVSLSHNKVLCAQLAADYKALRQQVPLPPIYADEIKAAIDQSQKAVMASCAGHIDEAVKLAKGNTHIRDFANKVENRFPELRNDPNFQAWDGSQSD